MLDCYNAGDFHKYFTENMNAVGLSVPSGIFESSEKAIATAALILGSIELLGPGATMAEVAGATVALEKLAVLGALSAVGYVGAAIGSIAVATGRSLSCGNRISDFFVFMSLHPELQFKGWHAFYSRHPGVLDKSHRFRRSFGVFCKDPATTFEYA